MTCEENSGVSSLYPRPRSVEERVLADRPLASRADAVEPEPQALSRERPDGIPTLHEHDLTMLMVTHQMGFAKEFADRVCFFHGGRICEQGSPDKIFGAPENDRTRQFLKAVLEAT